MRIKYDQAALQFITLLESLTGAKVKDCIVGDRITFFIEKGQMGLALGKGRKNLDRVERALKKPIKLIEFDEDIGQFVRNYTRPLTVTEIEQNGKMLMIKGPDAKTRGLLIGRERSNIKRMLSIVQRFFDIDEITVT